jgi:hypothetical protein
MTRYILLALFAILCEYAADKIVDWQFAHRHHVEQQGYSAEARAGMQKLVEKSLAKPRVSHRSMTEAERAKALNELWGG